MTRFLWMLVAACACYICCYRAAASQSDTANADATMPSTYANARHYTHAEFDALTPCFVDSIKVFDIARAKWQGIDIASLKAHGPKDDPEGSALVDKIYSDRFDDPWMYSLNHYLACTANHPNLSKDAVFVSQLCVTDGYIANFTYMAKRSGWSKDDVYAHLKNFETRADAAERTRTVVDRAYIPASSPGAIVVGAWGLCMTDAVHR